MTNPPQHESDPEVRTLGVSDKHTQTVRDKQEEQDACLSLSDAVDNQYEVGAMKPDLKRLRLSSRSVFVLTVSSHRAFVKFSKTGDILKEWISFSIHASRH